MTATVKAENDTLRVLNIQLQQHLLKQLNPIADEISGEI